MITPIKKPQHRDLLDWEKDFNKQVNKIRAVIERVIANFKTWRAHRLQAPYQHFRDNHLQRLLACTSGERRE